jgi:hypothetical protein
LHSNPQVITVIWRQHSIFLNKSIKLPYPKIRSTFPTMRKFSVSVNDSIIERYCYFRSLNLLPKFKSFWCFVTILTISLMSRTYNRKYYLEINSRPILIIISSRKAERYAVYSSNFEITLWSMFFKSPWFKNKLK